MAVLQALSGLQPGQVFPLRGESVILGRHPNCHIILESVAVSRQHARIAQMGGSYYIEDLDSRNGTCVNGQRIPARQPRPLAENDEVRICEVVFAFRQGPPPLKVTLPEMEGSPVATALVVDDERPSGGSTIMSKINISTGSSSVQTQVNSEAKLKALIEISQRLGRALRLSEVLPSVLDSLFRIFLQADRGFIVLRERPGGRLVPKAVKCRRQEDTETIRISRTIVNNVMATKEAILSADAATDARFEMAESIVDFHIRSVMCAPLIDSEGNALGVIQIDTQDQRTRFSRDDLDVLASVAYQAASAVENAQLHEAAVRQEALARDLALAHEMQRRLLPAGPPQIDQYDFFAFYAPADELGGDYYDYVALPDGRLAIVVADVSGHGISAALLMSRFSAATRFCLAIEPQPAAAMQRLNQDFCSGGWEDRFVTLVLCVLDPRRHEVTVVNAGHMPPLLRHGSRQIEPVGEEEARLPVGVDRDVTYAQTTAPLAPGDSLILYTDGITEAMNADDELYGLSRLRAQLSSPMDDGLSQLGQRILSDVRLFTGSRPQNDDICLTCFGRTGRT
jgi:serine phosphatase RsbU (regulator of sigma subunit)/pSer/pThr/pTyr-binding forkhead associated (FHA) protein